MPKRARRNWVPANGSTTVTIAESFPEPSLPLVEQAASGYIRPPIHELILPKLRRDIIGGRWSPGERVPEPELCEEFGISRTPLRSAFRVLQQDGLVDLLPNRGAVISRPTADDTQQKMDVLAALECLAVRQVCEKGSDATLEELDRLNADMAEAFAEGDFGAYYRYNDRIHRGVVEHVANPTLLSFHRMLMLHVDRIRHLAKEHEEVHDVFPRHHAELAAAMNRREASAASAIMHDHLQAVAGKLIRLLAGAASR